MIFAAVGLIQQSAWLAFVAWKPLRSHRGGGRGGNDTKQVGRSGPVSLGAASRFLWKRDFYLFFPLTFWLLFTFPGFLKPQGRNMKEDTHKALNGCCLCVHMHVCVCVYVFMYVSRWTGRAYFLSEKPIACAQNEVLNRMLSSSREVRAVWGNGCCSSARGCAEGLAQSSATSPWLVWGSEHLQELPTVSVMVWWGGDSSPTTGNRLQAMKQALTSITSGLISWWLQGRYADSFCLCLDQNKNVLYFSLSCLSLLLYLCSFFRAFSPISVCLFK